MATAGTQPKRRKTENPNPRVPVRHQAAVVAPQKLRCPNALSIRLVLRIPNRLSSAFRGGIYPHAGRCIVVHLLKGGFLMLKAVIGEASWIIVELSWRQKKIAQKMQKRGWFTLNQPLLAAKDCDINKIGVIVKFRNASTQCQNLKALNPLFTRWCFINDSYFPVFYKKDNPYFVISHGAGLTKHNHKWGTSLEFFHLQSGTHPTALCLGISFLAHW